MFVLPTAKTLIYHYLASGQRVEAAATAVREIDEFDVADLRAIVKMFASEVRARGNERRRGAPKRDEKPGWVAQQFRRTLAKRDFHACVLSRRLVDGDELSAEELADALWFIDMRLVPEELSADLEISERHKAVAAIFAADMGAAKAAILPLALETLEKFKLCPGRRNPRKGYKERTRNKIAAKYKISERLLRQLAK